MIKEFTAVSFVFTVLALTGCTTTGSGEWKTYHNSVFSIEYPSSWTVYATNANGTFIYDNVTSAMLTAGIAEKNTNKTLQQLTDELLENISQTTYVEIVSVNHTIKSDYSFIEVILRSNNATGYEKFKIILCGKNEAIARFDVETSELDSMTSTMNYIFDSMRCN